MKKLTAKFLRQHNACAEAAEWARKNKLIGKGMKSVTDACIKDNHYKWAVWLLPHEMNKKNRAQFAVFCAESVLPIYEVKYPHNNAPRLAIQAAKEWLENPTKDNARSAKNAADAAAYTAADEATADAKNAAYAAVYAADIATYSTEAAKNAAYAAAYSAAYAAHSAPDEATNAAYTANKTEINKNIIQFGLDILSEEK